MIVTFLKAAVPLTKTFTKTPQGIDKSSYPNVYEVTSISEQYSNLKEFAALLTKHSNLNHCMLKGNVSRALVNESRAGTTDPNAETSIGCLDVDGSLVKTIPAFMKAIGMDDVSYVSQMSASSGITDNLLRCHIFFQLDKPMAAPLLKQYLIELNFKIKELESALTLTKTGNALRYSLDITTCQNDKLIYIAPPICVGFKPPAIKRIQYVKRKRETFSFGPAPSVVVNKATMEEKIKSLRKAAKLPERKNTYKLVQNNEILVKPDESVITSMKEERGFVYLNLNGGDSWGYYHPSNNPDFIRNFKGEPTYLTKELLPDYWQQITSSAASKPHAPAASVKGVTYLAFLDKKGGQYWRGTYDSATDELDIYPAKNETQLRHFAAQSGFSLPEYVPEWELLFDPHNPLRVDIPNQRINTFQPTPYMLAHKATGFAKKNRTGNFAVIQKVLHHALGSDQAITDYYINWLAYIAQKLDRTRTAWILHGCTGTGKGLLMNAILKPLFGHVALKRMEELAEPYNGYMERCLMVFVDEVQTSSLRNEKAVMARIKNFITEPLISIRAMYQNAYPAANHTNWVFASNMPDPVAVDMNDRRFNVARYQSQKLDITVAEITEIPNQLQAFWDHLMSIKVDEEKASTPLATTDRTNLMQISEASIDTVARAILEGNFEFFLDHLPTNPVSNAVTMDLAEDYKTILLRLLKRSEDDLTCNISRDELRAIFEWTVGDMPKSPNKFTSRLKHHRLHTERLRVDGVVMHGIRIEWKEIPSDAAARLTGKPQSVAAPIPTIKKPTKEKA